MDSGNDVYREDKFQKMTKNLTILKQSEDETLLISWNDLVMDVSFETPEAIANVQHLLLSGETLRCDNGWFYSLITVLSGQP